MMKQLMDNEPVFTLATALSAILGLVLSICEWQGYQIPTKTQAAVIPAILAVAWLTRRNVTPTGNPMADSGEPLTPKHPIEYNGGNDET